MREEIMKPKQQFALFLMVIVGIVAIVVAVVAVGKRRAAGGEA
jgi:hypothetical protein